MFGPTGLNNQTVCSERQVAQTILRWLRRLVKAALWAVAVLLALAVALQWWIGPAVVRWQVNRRLAGFWDGTAAIGSVNMDVVGQTVSLGDVVLCDRQGRAWLRAASLEVSLEDMLSSRPVVRGLRAANAEVIVHCQGGLCRPPLLGAPPDGWAELLGLDHAVANGATLTVRNDGELVSRRRVQRVSYARKVGPGPGVSLLGSFGTFAFTDLKVEGFVVGKGRIELGRLTGRLGGGRVIVSARADKDPNGQWLPAGRVVAARVGLQQLKLRISGAAQGVVTGMANFRLESPDANGLTGQGMAFIEGADLSGAPMAAALLKSAGLENSEMLGKADGEGLFHFRGATATFDQARLNLPLAAVDIEPGATINVSTGQIDAVAVVVLFDRVRDMLKSLPVVGLMVDLTERFSRLRVRGLWHDEENIQITSAAISDVTSRTKQFLTDAARGRKRLGQGILNVLGIANGNFSTTSQPASGPATRPATRPADKPGR